MQDSTLLTEIILDQALLFDDSEGKMEEYDYVDCPLDTPLYFVVVAVNAFGESAKSETSHVSVLGKSFAWICMSLSV